MFAGSLVAIVTPFSEGKVDEASLEHLVSWHVNEGTQGIVVCGSTGEGILLTQTETARVIACAKQASSQRIPIVAGISCASTAEGIVKAQHAAAAGADGLLIVAPFYVKPSQQGIIEHIRSIHDSVDLPIILYNNPGRSVVEMSLDTVVTLATLKNVVALKDSTSDVTRPLELKQKLTTKKLTLLCGEDALTVAYTANGGDGTISVTANVAPKLSRLFFDAWKQGDLQLCQKINMALMPLHKVLFAESNPAPVKHALSLLGFCRNEMRLPLLPVGPATELKIKEAMAVMKTFDDQYARAA